MTRVLIVDDQPGFRSQLRQLLELAGLCVIGEAGDIPQAEQLARTLQPDLAVVDIMLPGVNGLIGAPRLKAAAPGMRVILVSAYSDRSHLFQRSALDVGAEAFVAKDELDLTVVHSWNLED
jgi:DNA-binding NarL/FixJ family response regulator